MSEPTGPGPAARAARLARRLLEEFHAERHGGVVVHVARLGGGELSTYVNELAAVERDIAS